MSQVIIVSNRLPISVKKEAGELVFYPSVGGLATGLASYVSDKRNQWIGWPGIASDELTQADRLQIVDTLAKHNCSPVFLSQKQIDRFYNGYSNGLLWPAFHGLPYRDTNKVRHAEWWQAYRTVNQEFADAVASVVHTKSNIWVHDYQLLLLPEMLRKSLYNTTIGFFLHIPFPGVKHFLRVPERKKLLQGILGADLVGFHTASYVEDFLGNCEAAGLGARAADHVVMPDHTVRVGNFPMGIDYEKYAQAVKSKVVKAAVKRYQRRYKGKRVIVAVDRMDPSKGLVERVRAYQRLLEEHKELHGKIVFSMIAAPSRTDIPAYQKLARQLEELVATTNETFGTKRWQPIDYMPVSQPFEEVTALFRVADVAFIAPIKDGMNLAAKEYIATKQKSGVLILSSTAGAAEELPDAVIVDPSNIDDLVRGLLEALHMSKRELRSRLSSMQTQLSTHTVQDWAKTFVDTLQQPVAGTPRLYTKSLQGTSRAILRHDYAHASKRLLLLDYDGSLVPFSADYADAKPPKALLNLLQTLADDTRNEIVVVSGRTAADLEAWMGHLPISLIAEHGAAIKKVGNKRWQNIEHEDTAWKRALIPILQNYSQQTPKSRLEIKRHSLVWHYRASPPYYAQKYAVTIKRVLKPYLKTHGLELFQGNKILEIKDPRISKGAVIAPWLKRYHNFVLAIGDDFTDEEMFQAVSPEAYSIKVGTGRTAARFRLKSSTDVTALLKALTR